MSDSPRPPSVLPFLCGAAAALAFAAGSNTLPSRAPVPATPLPAPAPARGQAGRFDGADPCLREAAALLPADTAFPEIASYFDQDGSLQLCTVDYQDPADPQRRIGHRFDVAGGRFGQPYAGVLPGRHEPGLALPALDAGR